MHVFLYEWITGGGLVEQSGRLPATLLAEGSAMISALAADFAAQDDCYVTVLRDVRLREPALTQCRIVEVDSDRDRQKQFDRLAAEADYTLAVAPEFDGILRQAAARVRSVGGRSLNSGDEFLEIASSKQFTADRLAAAGIAVPYARIYDADETRLPRDFAYPAVLKPIDGAGSQHTYLVEGPLDEPEPYPWPRRLEKFVPGRAASVAVLCGPNSRHALPACWQYLSTDGRLGYRGGAVIQEPLPAARAQRLALAALDALPAAHGYVGVDLVLGDAADGSEDVVIEINPRLTTSYVGLRAAMPTNLAEAMLAVAEGRPVDLSEPPEPIEFAATGETWLEGLAPSVVGKWR